MTTAISSRQRYSRTRRCPICGGCEQDPRGKEKRCTGYDGSDGKYAHCSREEHAGSLEQEASGTYAHKLAGKCKCGETHGEDNSVRPQIVATYDYVDEARALLFQVVRYDPKNFRQRSPNGAGGWIWSTKDVRKVLYRLPELLAADPQSPVYFCEGEKDVGALESRGLLATTSPGGAEDYGLNLWRNGLADHARKVLAGRAVHIIADKDRVGRDFARMVAGQLHDAARSLDVWECTLGKDAAAHLAAGGAMEDLEPLGDADDERAAIQDEPASDWPTPEPFDVVTLPAFPVEALSPWMRDWATAESTFTQTPVDLSACLALAAVSLAAARSFHVHVRGDYKEPCNLWIVVALEPGEKKSSVFADATAPIYAYGKHVAEKLAPTIHERAQARRILEAQVKDAETHAVKGKNIGGVDARQVARERQAELDKLPEIHAPVLLTADCTPEALAVLLSHHGERMGIFSAEGGPFEMMAGRYADAGKTNLEIYLMGHPGDAHVVHRISREPINLSHPLLTMGLTVQPHVIAGLAGKDGFRGRGLLGRFFYSLPRTALGHRVAEPPTVDGAVTLAYQTALASILMLLVEPRTLHLSPEAARARAALHDEIEPRLDPNDGDLYLVADWANKLVGGVCRLAGVLHVADHATSLATLPEDIPAATFDRAATIGRYFLVHSLHAFDAMGADDDLELARRVWAWVQRKGLASFTEYEAKRATHATPETIKLALAKLLDRNLVRERPPEGPTGGRPSSPSYDLNPRARR